MEQTVLLFGGNSDEKLVSVASAQNLAQHFPFEEFWFVNSRAEVFSVSADSLKAHARPFENEFVPEVAPFASSVEGAISTFPSRTFFFGFHGAEGEDGTLQRLFEEAEIAFTGSGSASSKICFDKTKGKLIASANGIQVAPGLILSGKFTGEIREQLVRFFENHQKIVVKPIANGSSVGLHVISDRSALDRLMSSWTSEIQLEWLAEKFIQGRELTVGVIEQEGKLVALPPSEVLLKQGHSFDFNGKYLGVGTTEVTPAELIKEDWDHAQALALQAHKVLQCYGYSRTDLILTPSGLIFLETNTLPGLTKASFIPQQLNAAGIKMNDFITHQMELARNRY